MRTVYISFHSLFGIIFVCLFSYTKYNVWEYHFHKNLVSFVVCVLYASFHIIIIIIRAIIHSLIHLFISLFLSFCLVCVFTNNIKIFL